MSGKAYYLAPAMLVPLVTGAVFAEGLLAQPRVTWLRPTVLALLLLSALIPLPIVVPVLSADRLGPYMETIGIAPKPAEKSTLGVLPQHLADRFGWEELAGVTATAWRSLTDDERRNAIIVGANYGETAAVNYYGRRLGLPTAVSQHNSFYLWGPGNTAATVVITIGQSVEDLRGAFEDVRPVATMSDPLAMPYERTDPVAICRRPKRPLMVLWVEGKKFI
jgi:hypothetical protein